MLETFSTLENVCSSSWELISFLLCPFDRSLSEQMFWIWFHEKVLHSLWFGRTTCHMFPWITSNWSIRNGQVSFIRVNDQIIIRMTLPLSGWTSSQISVFFDMVQSVWICIHQPNREESNDEAKFLIVHSPLQENNQIFMCILQSAENQIDF